SRVTGTPRAGGAGGRTGGPLVQERHDRGDGGRRGRRDGLAPATPARGAHGSPTRAARPSGGSAARGRRPARRRDPVTDGSRDASERPPHLGACRRTGVAAALSTIEVTRRAVPGLVRCRRRSITRRGRASLPGDGL